MKCSRIIFSALMLGIIAFGAHAEPLSPPTPPPVIASTTYVEGAAKAISKSEVDKLTTETTEDDQRKIHESRLPDDIKFELPTDVLRTDDKGIGMINGATVPAAQIPDLSDKYIPTSQKNQKDGVAGTGLIPNTATLMPDTIPDNQVFIWFE